MDKAITVADLIYGTGVLLGLAMMGIGVIASFAAGMASSPTDESRRIGRNGCMAVIVGLVIFAYCLWTLLR